MARSVGVAADAFVVVLGVASRAHAEPPERTPPRARFAIGGYAGAAGVPDWHGGGGGGIGFYIRGGIQYSELVGFDLQGSATTALFLGTARAALMVDFSFKDWLSIGTGASANAFYTTGLVGGSDYTGGVFGVPLRVAFHTGRRRADGVRRGLELLLEADFGVSALTNRSNRDLDPAGALYAGIGYARF